MHIVNHILILKKSQKLDIKNFLILILIKINIIKLFLKILKILLEFFVIIIKIIIKNYKLKKSKSKLIIS